MSDEFASCYSELLDGCYDCVDRIVLNAYFQMAQSGGGFRKWWRDLRGGDEDLDSTHLMRFAGRFSRRVRKHAEVNGIPLIDCKRGERKHEIAEKYIPADENARGVFCILVGRAPAPVREVQRYSGGGFHISHKKPRPYVNQYSFHIMDDEWGRLVIKLCPHPPFNAQVILNGHEYVARRARRLGIGFTKEGNCFTDVSDAAGLAGVADTMSASSAVGRLARVCERWIYSSCLCFALDMVEQRRSGFHYSYSVYQAEYSRNFLFKRGRRMEQVFDGIIDRTRAPLEIKTVKTIFGYSYRPRRRRGKNKSGRFEAAVERPVYNMTVFKIHFKRLTVKIYSKGERALRIEAVAHNTKDLRCGKVIERFPKIVSSLREMVEQFLLVLRCADTSFIDNGTLEELPLPSTVGATRVGGLDINKPRTLAAMEAVVALSTNLRGFFASDMAAKVREILGCSAESYNSRQAAYDLRKLRGKKFIEKVDRTRRYRATPEGLRSMMALHVLLEKVVKPLLAGAGKRRRGRKPGNRGVLDQHYETIQIQMQRLFKFVGIAS